MEKEPSYYGIIPANVRYDNSLSMGAKIMYCEITALSSKTGECWASNGYFSNLYEVDDRTVNRWVTELVNAGYIERLLDSNSLNERRRILKVTLDPVPTKIAGGPEENVMTGPDKNVGYNNTSINNTSINIGERTKMSLPPRFGKTGVQRVVGIYSLLWRNYYDTDFKLTNWGKVGKLFKPLLETYSELQVASLVWIHFNWHGMSGTDDFAFKRITDQAFPIEWIPRSASQYETYIKNVVGIDFDNPDEVQRYIVPILKGIEESIKIRTRN